MIIILVSNLAYNKQLVALTFEQFWIEISDSDFEISDVNE